LGSPYITGSCVKGDISVLAKYTQVTKVDFYGCDEITGEFRV